MPGRFPPPARLAVLILFAVMAAEGTAAADPPTPCPAGATDRAALVCEINAARAAAGRGPVKHRPSLADAARRHSADMVERRFFAHEAPDGTGPADRVRDSGYLRHADTWRLGEILLWSSGEPLTAARAVEMWLESPSHRRILLSPRFRDVGAGPVPGAPLGDGGASPATTVTVVFGRRG